MKIVKIETWGEICPVPIIKVEKQLKQIEVGDTIELITDHSCTCRSFQNWNKKHKQQVESNEIDNGVWCIRITKLH